MGHDEGREEKQRIEKDAEELVKKHSADRALNEGRKKWYIAGATAENNRLNDQLAKERQLRKELVEKLVAVIDEYATMDIVKIKHDYPYYEDEYKYIRTLIQEAKGT